MSRRRLNVPASWRPWVLLWALLPLLFWSMASPVAHTHGAAYGPAAKAVSCHGHPVQTVDALHHCFACDWESIASGWPVLAVAPAVLVRPAHKPVAQPVAQLISRRTPAFAARGPPNA